VQYWDDTLSDEVQSIRSLLQSASSSSAHDAATNLSRAEKKYRAAQGTKKSYKMETRLITDPKQRKIYENKLMVLSEELSNIANDINVLKSNRNKGELFVGASTKIGGGEGNNGEMSGEEAGNHMISDMNTLQDKTKASISNTKQMVSASKAVGESTMEELLRQREQIRTIDNEALRIEDNLVRADKLIKTFGKRMATDRFIQCFACINVLLLVGVVVYTIVKKGNFTGGGNNTGGNSNVPTNPVGGGSRLLRGWLLLTGEDYDDEGGGGDTDWYHA
jgi:SNARE protein